MKSPEVANAWAGDPQGSAPLADTTVGQTRLLDFFLGIFVLFPYTPFGDSAFITVGQIALSILLFAGFIRPPTRPLGPLKWLPFLLATVLVYLAVLSIATPDESLFGWTKRAQRLLLVGLFFMFIVSGRLDTPSIVRGSLVGLLANAGLFFVGLGPHQYGEFLSGYLLDKNQAGFIYAAIGVLAVGQSTKIPWQILGATVFGGLVWSTGSRTGIAAYVLGLVWFWGRPYFKRTARWSLLLAVVAIMQFVESRFALSGDFSDRLGSDWLRERIDAASQLKVDGSPWYGRGLGEAFIWLGDRWFLFHNSLLGARAEGGYPYLIVILAMTLILGVGVFHKNPPASRLFGASEAANIVVLICATRLGEVFNTTTALLVLGLSVIGFLEGEASTDADPPAALERVVRRSSPSSLADEDLPGLGNLVTADSGGS